MDDDIDLNAAVRRSAMLATYHTTAWSGRARDTNAAAAAAAAAGADPRAYTTHKNLMYGADTLLKAVTNIQSHGRKLHLENTLPWGGENERGLRMLPVVKWQPYMQKVAGVKKEFTEALEKFLDRYPVDRAKAMQKLKITSHVGIYPSVDELRRMFTLRPAFQPIPAGAHFQGLPDGVCQQLANSYEDRMKVQFRRATTAVMERTIEALDTFHERLGSGTGMIYGSTWQSIVDLPPMIESFNLIHDPEITKLANRIKTEMVNSTSLEELRKLEKERERIQKKAAELSAYTSTLI